MASVFGHTIIAITATKIVGRKTNTSKYKLILLSVLSAIMPDADVLAFRWGIPYEHMLGHRGLSHSIFFAILWSVALVLLFFRDKTNTKEKWLIFLTLFISTISHGILDGMTTGGKGIAYFAPFDDTRYFLPWRVIKVSPIGVSHFFSEWGLAVLQSEALYIFLPCIVLLLIYRLTSNRAAS